MKASASIAVGVERIVEAGPKSLEVATDLAGRVRIETGIVREMIDTRAKVNPGDLDRTEKGGNVRLRSVRKNRCRR